MLYIRLKSRERNAAAISAAASTEKLEARFFRI